MRPRITIYPFNDTTYATQLYSYNGFSDIGSTTKPISLRFEGTTTGAGSFSIEIEDSDGLLDSEALIKGNRVFIECSSNGSTWQPAFKGLVRSCERYLIGAQGSTYTISGYSYLIRLNERIINTIKQSALIGPDYNRADSTMFTDNLINDLLTTDSNYVYGLDDTQQYSLFKTTNITSSPVTDWVPRLDAQLVPITDAINSILEFSTALIMMDPANDQLVLFDPQQPTTGTGIFLVTDQPNLIADNAAYTMYPVEPYRYNVSYDYPDSGSRLIGSIGPILTKIADPTGSGGNPPCPPQPPIDPIETGDHDVSSNLWFYDNRFVANITGIGSGFRAPSSTLKGVRLSAQSVGNLSARSQTDNIRVYNQSGTQIGSDVPIYPNGVPGTPYPAASTYQFWVGMADGVVGPTLVPSTIYWLVWDSNVSVSSTQGMAWISQRAAPSSPLGAWEWSTGHGLGTTWANGTYPSLHNLGAISYAASQANEFIIEFAIPGTDACGGGGGTVTPPPDPDPVFAVAEDKNMSKRLGMVERVLSGIPTHIRTTQTMNEYLFSKLFTASKPRFTFDFPAVTIPTTIPKAGDIVAHVCKKAGVGTTRAPVQSGIITSVNYDFRQDDEGVMGLTKMGLSTTGIRRGYY